MKNAMKIFITMGLMALVLILTGCGSYRMTDDDVSEFCESFIRQIEDEYVTFENNRDRDSLIDLCGDELSGYLPADQEQRDVGLF